MILFNFSLWIECNLNSWGAAVKVFPVSVIKVGLEGLSTKRMVYKKQLRQQNNSHYLSDSKGVLSGTSVLFIRGGRYLKEATKGWHPSLSSYSTSYIIVSFLAQGQWSLSRWVIWYFCIYLCIMEVLKFIYIVDSFNCKVFFISMWYAYQSYYLKQVEKILSVSYYNASNPAVNEADLAKIFR